jgi:hypothetical protein
MIGTRPDFERLREGWKRPWRKRLAILSAFLEPARRASHGSFAKVCPAPREKINRLIDSEKQKYGLRIPPR